MDKRAMPWVVLAVGIVLGTAACEPSSGGGAAACDHAKCDLWGNAEQGTPCDFDIECKADDGLVCLPADRTLAYDPELLDYRVFETFECRAPVSIDMRCAEDSDCEQGLFCIPSERLAIFIETVGTAGYNELGFGGICHDAPSPRGGPCWSDDNCEEGLECLEGVITYEYFALEQLGRCVE